LGYHPDQVHTILGNFDGEDTIKHIGVEVFTDNVVFVMTKPLASLERREVNHFLKAHDVKNIFRDYTVEDILQTGIDNQSLDINFLARVLKIKNPSLYGVFSVPSIGYDLLFNGGFLEHFTPLDGLNCWAKMWKGLNPKLTNDYFDQAKKYGENDRTKAVREVNIQANAFANTLGGIDTPLKDLHITEDGLVNYAMLTVTHYDAPISLDDFKAINHGIYEVVSNDENNDGLSHFKVGWYVYKFDNKGTYKGYE
jgi:hypothetical protein